MNRSLSVLLLAFILVVMIFSAGCDFTDDFTISYFENYTVEGFSLNAESVRGIQPNKGARCSSSDTVLSVTGECNKSKPFNVKITINDGAFTDPQELNGNYYVLSVINARTFIRIILKDKVKNDIMYIDIQSWATKRPVIDSYNINWYRSFVGGQISTDKEIISPPNDRNSFYTIERIYSTANLILGDVYTETMSVKAVQNCPPVINNSTGGFFIFSLGIGSKQTSYTPYGGNTVYSSGCSLGINQTEFNIAAPVGEYFSELTTNFVGSIFNNTSPFTVRVNWTLPYTPLSIAYSYSNTTTYTGYGYFTYPAGSSNKVRQAGNIWGGSGYWAYAAAPSGAEYGDYFYAKLFVNTDVTNQVLGSKSMSFRWDYHVTGTGINPNYGVSVDTPNTYAYISNSVTYTLLDVY